MPSPKDQNPPRPFGHFRLVAFFVLLGAVCALLGVWRLRRLDEAPSGEVEWILGSSVLLCAGLGFAGVFFHRLRVNPVRWRETQDFLIAIRRESHKYRALMEGAADMLLVVDPVSGTILEWSTRAKEELRNRTPDPDDSPERARVGLQALVAEADRERLRAGLDESARQPGASVSLEELRVNGARGRALIADARLAAVEVEGVRVVQVSLRDVTRQKEMERSLRVHERLSSIGLLTAGVAHEINNPLEGIGNYLKLLEREDLPEDTRKRYLELVGHGFGRIREIVRDLLRFARPKRGDGEADLAEVVARARALASFADVLRGIEIETRGLDAPLRLLGDAGRLEQVVVNLLLNAATALSGRGRIEVRARAIPSSGAQPAEIELVVADDGPGIGPDDLPRVFDPFFTTTEGTGLGLSVSYGIVQAHGGRIWAENAPGGGAVFTIRLPARRTPRAEERHP